MAVVEIDAVPLDLSVTTPFKYAKLRDAGYVISMSRRTASLQIADAIIKHEKFFSQEESPDRTLLFVKTDVLVMTREEHDALIKQQFQAGYEAALKK